MKPVFLMTLLLLALQAMLLLSFGQPLICTCGYIKLWEGVVLSSGNSQHLTDWYSFSHIIHGFLYYALAWLLFPRASIGIRFLFALGLEVSWEVIENTPMMIEHYRLQALSLGYKGDSVINSLSDTCMMIAGFWLARFSPVWLIVLIGIGLEAWTAYMIHDNLTLNIINLIHPFTAIHQWQTGVSN